MRAGGAHDAPPPPPKPLPHPYLLEEADGVSRQPVCLEELSRLGHTEWHVHHLASHLVKCLGCLAPQVLRSHPMSRHGHGHGPDLAPAHPSPP